MTLAPTCPLCQPADPATLLWRDDKLHVIDVGDPELPGYTRVIWNAHAAEMTDLAPADRAHVMNAVWLVEQVMRAELMPAKVNLAQLGNRVPHVHWHIIPRWPLDPHFPDAIWAAPQTRNPEQQLAWEVFRDRQWNLLADYHATLRKALDDHLK